MTDYSTNATTTELCKGVDRGLNLQPLTLHAKALHHQDTLKIFTIITFKLTRMPTVSAIGQPTDSVD